jgi:hypothetical protein
MGAKPYLRDPQTGKHRQKNDDHLYVHYPKTCSVYDAAKVYQYTSLFANRSTPTMGPKHFPSRYGWVLVYYEVKGLITFSVQINPKRAAWQRIKWKSNLGDLNKAEVKKAIEAFIEVAEHELQRTPLPQKS